MKHLIALVTALVLTLSAANGFAAETTQTAKAKAESKKASLMVERVNINSANAETIAANLDRVGIKKAQAIVAYRESNGKFNAKEDLLNVKGIGEATLRLNASKIVL